MTAYGSDFSGVDDVDQFLTFLEGDDEIVAFMQSIARRYTTQRYGLFYDPTYGLDLRLYLSDVEPVEVVQGLIGLEARKDPRVQDAKASITESGSPSAREWAVTIEVTPLSGPPFTLTLSVDSVSVTLLNGG